MSRMFYVRRWVLLLAIPVVLLAAMVVLPILYVLVHRDGDATLPADCAVVFGAAVHPLYGSGGKVVASQAGPAILRRVAVATDLYRRGMVKKLFLTGGRGEGMRLSEAQVMKGVAMEGGVKPRDIVLEDRSSSTVENVRNTAPLTGSCSSVVGISDGYHLARIEFLAWRAGWQITTLPSVAPIEPRFEAWSIVREVLALVYEATTGK